MACYCVARRKPIRREKLTKPQTTIVISLWLSVCSHVLNLIVIDHYKSTFLKFFKYSVHGFLSLTVKGRRFVSFEEVQMARVSSVIT